MSRCTDYETDDERAILLGNLWRGTLTRAMKSKRGLVMFRTLERALLEMPSKRLIADALVKDGEVCVNGALLIGLGKSLDDLEEAQAQELRDYGDGKAPTYDSAAIKMAIAAGVVGHVAEHLMSTNDDVMSRCTPEARYTWMLDCVRQWIADAERKHGVTKP